MAARVLLPNAFQKHTNKTRELASSAANLPERNCSNSSYRGYQRLSRLGGPFCYCRVTV
jgi:hypothetical protein